MKKFIALAVVVLVAITGVQAQTNSAKVKVNVELNPFQSIEIGSGALNPIAGYGDEVTLTYNNANDYKNGVSKTVAKQLKVSSVGSGYKINASLAFASNSGNFGKVNGNGEATVAAGELLEIAIATNGAANGLATGKVAAANMEFGPFGATSDGNSSVLDQELDVKYFGKKLNEETVRKLFGNGKTQAKYTLDVVYTIATN